MCRERPWTVAEDEFLRKHYPKMSYRKMAKKINRTHEAVRHRCLMIGLTSEKGCIAYNLKDNEYMDKIRRELNG